jgi:1-deoxy-D-xylulose-5-phosphate reductoisomerase
MHKGGNSPCVLNAANEVAVDAFLKEQVGFLQMSDVVEKCLLSLNYIAKPSYEDYVETDKITRIAAKELIGLGLKV